MWCAIRNSVGVQLPMSKRVGDATTEEGCYLVNYAGFQILTQSRRNSVCSS